MTHDFMWRHFRGEIILWVGQVFMIKRTGREYRCARNGKPAWFGEPSVEIVCGITSHTPETAGAE